MAHEGRDEAHRALGAYVDAFSRLIEAMQTPMMRHLRDCGVPLDVARLPFGPMMARQIGDVFYGMAVAVHEHDEKDLRVARKIYSRVVEEIEVRNDVAHGLWMIGAYVEVLERGRPSVLEPLPPSLHRVKPSRKAGPLVSAHPNLDELVETVRELRGHVRAYALACFDEPGTKQIRDYVRLDDKKALEAGPLRT